MIKKLLTLTTIALACLGARADAEGSSACLKIDGISAETSSSWDATLEITLPESLKSGVAYYYSYAVKGLGEGEVDGWGDYDGGGTKWGLFSDFTFGSEWTVNAGEINTNQWNSMEADKEISKIVMAWGGQYKLSTLWLDNLRIWEKESGNLVMDFDFSDNSQLTHFSAGGGQPHNASIEELNDGDLCLTLKSLSKQSAIWDQGIRFRFPTTLPAGEYDVSFYTYGDADADGVIPFWGTWADGEDYYGSNHADVVKNAWHKNEFILSLDKALSEITLVIGDYEGTVLYLDNFKICPTGSSVNYITCDADNHDFGYTERSSGSYTLCLSQAPGYTPGTSKLENAFVENNQSVYYNIQGSLIQHPEDGNIYIIKRGDKVYKIVK